MAYDQELARRIREELAGEPHVAEKRMFGGLAFLVNGNMAIAASGQGGLMVRVDPAATEMLDEPGAAPMEMRGRPMRGWILVGGDAVVRDEALQRWVREGVSYAARLPPK